MDTVKTFEAEYARIAELRVFWTGEKIEVTISAEREKRNGDWEKLLLTVTLDPDQVACVRNQTRLALNESIRQKRVEIKRLEERRDDS